MRLKDKVCVLTGAAQGLGKGIAEYMALSEQCRVVVNDIDREKLQQTVSGIKDKKGKVVSHVGDVGECSVVEAMLKVTLDEYATVDILINNAGVVFVKPTLELTDQEWDKTMRVNLRGTFLCSQIFSRHMVDNKIKGRIINMSSKSGKNGGLWLSSYCASKFGIIGFTQSLALDLAEYGLTVNAVCPGIVFTPIWDRHDHDYAKKLKMEPEQVRDYYVKKIPLGRSGTPEDVAKVIAFLCSEDAAYMTGQAINVTGGQEMR